MIFPIISTLDSMSFFYSFITTKISQIVYFEGCLVGYFEDYLKR